jgi:hypothetical protein
MESDEPKLPAVRSIGTNILGSDVALQILSAFFSVLLAIFVRFRGIFRLRRR